MKTVDGSGFTFLLLSIGANPLVRLIPPPAVSSRQSAPSAIYPRRRCSAMLTLIAGAPLALRTPQPVSTRRDALIAASGLAASASVLPAYAGLPFDPIGAYGKIGPGPMGPPPRVKGQPNSGILLLREVFDGALPEEGLLAWYEEHLAADFTATFAGGKVVLDRQASPPPPPGGAS